jgi:predicted phosphodiesterase
MKIIKSRHSIFSDIVTVAILADPGCRAGWEKNFPRLLAHVWQKHRPELFLVVGDLAINGTYEEYEAMLSVINCYPSRLAAVAGDHDKPLTAFRRLFGSTRKIIDVGKWRFLGIDTSNRVFLKSESDFLAKHLRRNTLILSHVPPALNGWEFHSLLPTHSDRFLSIVDCHASKIRAAFFGHIHGYSRRTHSGVPMIATGAVAESLVVRNNRYIGPGYLGMMIFKPRTGKLTLCRLNWEKSMLSSEP